jgi:hypothetical protein
MSPYEYVRSNPLIELDPSGLVPLPDPNNLPNGLLLKAWGEGIKKEAAAGNKMSASFMVFYRSPQKDRSLRFTDGLPFTNQVEYAPETKEEVTKLLLEDFKKRGFDPCCYCEMAKGGQVRVSIPTGRGRIGELGSVKYTSSEDLHHAIHEAQMVIGATAGEVEVSNVGDTCVWSLVEDVDVTVLDTYNFKRGGAGANAPARLRFANDLGAELQARGLGRPFSVQFDFKTLGGGTCGLNLPDM